VICVSAPLSPMVARSVGIKLTAATGLVAIGIGLGLISMHSSVTATYGAMVPGMLLIGMGA